MRIPFIDFVAIGVSGRKQKKRQNTWRLWHTVIVKQRLKVDKQYEDRIRTVFHELSTPELLDRCLKGENQHKIEALHSKIWYHHSKAKFAGLKRVNFLTQLTLLDHNFGYVANKFLQHLGYSTSSESLRLRHRMDKRKIALRNKSNKKQCVTKPCDGYQAGNY